MTAIIKREILEHLQSLQFIILLILSILLFSMNGWVSVKKHREQMRRYSDGSDGDSTEPEHKRDFLVHAPQSLSSLADGGSKYQPPGYSLGPKGKLTSLPAGPKNFKMPFVPNWIGRSS